MTQINISSIKLNEEGIDRFKEMIKETKIEGRTNICPRWDKSSNFKSKGEGYLERNCCVCMDCFPSINREVCGNRDCPCNCGHYDRETILAFLEQMIKQSEEK